MIRTPGGHYLGQRPDDRDHRDLEMAPPYAPSQPLPDKVDLRNAWMPTVEDQGALGSCTSFAIAGAVMYDRAKQGLPAFTPSHLHVYYHERLLEGTVASDAGAMIRDGCKVVNQVGVAPELLWPYDVTRFAQAPPAAAERAAATHRAVVYQRVRRDEQAMRAVLASGLPIVVGISVYESFESDAMAKSGVVPMPRRGERLLGGHACLLSGYDDTADTWLLRNSWSAEWGQSGYFTLPAKYLLSARLSSDFWTVVSMQG